MDFYKTYIKMISILLSLAGVIGTIYIVVRKYMLKKSFDADNKLKYVTFNSTDDEFISEKSA